MHKSNEKQKKTEERKKKIKFKNESKNISEVYLREVSGGLQHLILLTQVENLIRSFTFMMFFRMLKDELKIKPIVSII